MLFNTDIRLGRECPWYKATRVHIVILHSSVRALIIWSCRTGCWPVELIIEIFYRASQICSIYKSCWFLMAQKWTFNQYFLQQKVKRFQTFDLFETQICPKRVRRNLQIRLEIPDLDKNILILILSQISET